jgi:hypothetical protein
MNLVEFLPSLSRFEIKNVVNALKRVLIQRQAVTIHHYAARLATQTCNTLVLLHGDGRRSIALSPVIEMCKASGRCSS